MSAPQGWLTHPLPVYAQGVTGFLKNDYSLIGRSLEDVIIEPVRSILIPGFDEVKKKSKEAGALGGGISGSGPSIFMLCKEFETAKEVENLMKNVYQRIGVDFKTYITTHIVNPITAGKIAGVIFKIF